MSQHLLNIPLGLPIDSNLPTVDSDLIITGDLTVQGSLIVEMSATVLSNIQTFDNIITLNTPNSGSGVSRVLAGMEVDRGVLSDTGIIFDETDDEWKVSYEGSASQAIVVRNGSVITPGAVQYGGAAYGIKEDPTKLFFDETNKRLGIGTNSPDSMLNLVSTSNPSININNTNSTVQLQAIADNSGGKIGTYSNNKLCLVTNSLERGCIDATGNFGLGTQTPSAKLDVSGSNVSSLVTDTSGTQLKLNANNSTNTVSIGSASNTPVSIIVNNSNSATFNANGLVVNSISGSNYTFTNSFNLVSQGTSKVVVTSAGDVGIGPFTTSITPGSSAATTVTAISPASLHLHSASTNNEIKSGTQVNEWLIDTNAAANTKAMLARYENQTLNYRSLNDNFTDKKLNVLVIDGVNKAIGIGTDTIGSSAVMGTTVSLTGSRIHCHDTDVSQILMTSNAGGSVYFGDINGSSNAKLIGINAQDQKMYITSYNDNLGAKKSNILYVDGQNGRIGVNTNAPSTDFQVNGVSTLGQTTVTSLSAGTISGGATIFNPGFTDNDFKVRRQTSGDAINYDAGNNNLMLMNHKVADGSIDINGDAACYISKYAANDYRFEKGLGNASPSVGVRLETLNNQIFNIYSSLYFRQSLGNINSSRYDALFTGTDLWFNYANSDVNFVIKKNSAGEAFNYDAGLDTLKITTPTTFSNTIDLSSGQIKFPTTQNASADANTLDDYEEGTFTPALSFLTAQSGSFTYGTQTGTYTKIGNTVHCDIILAWTAIPTGGSEFTLTGLPFQSAASTRAVSGPVYAAVTTGSWATRSPDFCIAGYSQVVATFRRNGTTSPSTYAYNEIPSNGEINMHFSYRV